MAIKEVGNVNLVIVDTLHRNMGGGSEDSADDFGLILKNIDTFLKPLGVTTLIVHHCGHGNQDRARGSYSIRASMDFEYQVVKNGSKITVKNTKMKDGDTPKPLAFELKPVEIGLDDDGEVITSAYLSYAGETEATANEKRKPKLSANDDAILTSLDDAIAKHGVSPTQMIKEKFGGFDGLANQYHKVVNIEFWRELAFKTIVDDSKTRDAKYKAFARSLKKLRDHGLIEHHDDYAWRVY